MRDTAARDLLKGRNQYDAPPVIERFREKYTVDAESGCWLWHGCTIPAGYGAMKIDGEMVGAHRWAYERFIGPIPDGMVIDHLCRTRNCVNPQHMEPVSNVKNVMRGNGIGARNSRKTHCKHGHPFAGDNLIIEKRGGGRTGRRCRQCTRIMRRKLAKAS